MRATLTLIRREFSAYFYSPIAYVVMAGFLSMTGYLFFLTLGALTAQGPRGISYPMELFVNSAPFWLVFAAVAPLLTMRLFAEERSSGTLEMLMTAPVRDWQVVLAKYVACYGFYITMWLPTLVYLPILTNTTWNRIAWADLPAQARTIHIVLGIAWLVLALAALAGIVRSFLVRHPASELFAMIFLGVLIGALIFGLWPFFTERLWWSVEYNLDPWPIITTYIGLALAGAMFLSIGIFVSSLVKSQMVAALISLFLGLIFVVGAIWRPEMDAGGTQSQILFYVTVPLHFERNFGRGLIDTRNLVLYGSITLLTLFLTVRSLEGRRWQ